jgi:hypothetical protein
MNDNAFFNPDQLIKFANDFKRDDDLSEHLSLSCSNNSTKDLLFFDNKFDEHFIESSLELNINCNYDNESDSGNSSNSGMTKKPDDMTISEHMEFTCSNDSLKNMMAKKFNDNLNENHFVISLNQELDNEETENENDHDIHNDTSDDASDIPTDSDSLNDSDLGDENYLTNGSGSNIVESNNYNQVIEKDGTMSRRKLDCGIYCSINQTLSLFIEPNDILKQMDSTEYEEYSLFPNTNDSNFNVSSSFIKNHLYAI